MIQGGDQVAGKRELVTVIEPSDHRRLRLTVKEAAIATTDERGRMEFRPVDIDLALKALAEHYKRRTH